MLIRNPSYCKQKEVIKILFIPFLDYYIAERLIKGTFTKFNGEGDSMDKDQKITSYFNAFSLFTYYATQKMLMVSNI